MQPQLLQSGYMKGNRLKSQSKPGWSCRREPYLPQPLLDEEAEAWQQVLWVVRVGSDEGQGLMAGRQVRGGAADASPWAS